MTEDFAIRVAKGENYRQVVKLLALPVEFSEKYRNTSISKHIVLKTCFLKDPTILSDSNWNFIALAVDNSLVIWKNFEIYSLKINDELGLIFDIYWSKNGNYRVVFQECHENGWK